MQVQHSLIPFWLHTSSFFQMQFVQYVIYGGILLIVLKMALELYLAGHIHTMADIFSPAAGHPHAASFTQRFEEGPADIALFTEGPPDGVALSVA